MVINDDLLPLTACGGVRCQRSGHDKPLYHEGGHMVVHMMTIT